MSSGKIRMAPLRSETFAPFGTVIDLAGLPARSVNEGRGIRADLPDLDHEAQAGRPATAIYRMAPTRLPLPLREIEKHPLSAQLFAPLDPVRFVVVVAPGRLDGEPDLAGLRAFCGGAGQGVVYAPDVWHMPLAILGDREAQVLMQIWEAGDPLDCIVRRLDGLSPIDF
ncbi:ureidoglycolate lyase [Alsobacter sp. SYSU BS001988]|jgi:ureidoglycolate lyase